MLHFKSGTRSKCGIVRFVPSCCHHPLYFLLICSNPHRLCYSRRFSAVPSGLPSSSALRPSSVPQLPFQGDSVSKDFQGHLDIIHEQHDAATWCLSDLRNVRIELAVATATRTLRDSTMTSVRAENFRLRGEVSPLTP